MSAIKIIWLVIGVMFISGIILFFVGRRINDKKKAEKEIAGDPTPDAEQKHDGSVISGKQEKKGAKCRQLRSGNFDDTDLCFRIIAFA